MVLSIILLVVAFGVVRFVVMRYAGYVVVANVVGLSVVVAFIIGSLVRPFGEPGSSPAPQDTPVAATSDPSAVPAASNVRDVSSQCRGLVQAPTAGGLGAFDNFSAANDPRLIGRRGESLSSKLSYVAVGWGADSDQKDPAVAVCLLVDGKVDARAVSRYGMLRPDVADALKQPALSPVGFRISIPPGTLPKGAHTLMVATRSQDGSMTIVPNAWAVDVH